MRLGPNRAACAKASGQSGQSSRGTCSQGGGPRWPHVGDRPHSAQAGSVPA